MYDESLEGSWWLWELRGEKLLRASRGRGNSVVREAVGAPGRLGAERCEAAMKVVGKCGETKRRRFLGSREQILPLKDNVSRDICGTFL